MADSIDSCASCGKPGSAELTLRKCSSCRVVQYCSRDCQRADWKQHKTTCGLTTPPADNNDNDTSAGASTANPSPHSRPNIVLLALEKQPWFDEMYSSLLDALKANADIEEATASAAALDLLNAADKPDVILATDEALSSDKYIGQRRRAAAYVRNGGTLIFMGTFSGFARPPAIKTMFTEFSLPWQSGDYHRTTFRLNSDMHHITTDGLVPEYSQKALHLAGVARGDAVYLPTASSHTQSHVFAPEPVDDHTQTPAAFGSSGRGKVGYIGDVNTEEGTTKVVLAMCGIVG